MSRFTVLGCNGFIGSNLCKHLRENGHDVIAADRTWLSGARSSDFSVHPYNQDLGHVIYAIGLTADFRGRLRDTMQAHVTILNETLQSARFDSLLYLSSTRIYDHNGSTSEDAQIAANPAKDDDSYNISKLAGESSCLAWPDEKVRVARLSNVVGFDTGSQNFLTTLIQEAALEGRITLLQSEKSEKNYINISDVCSAIEMIALQGRHRLYNVAGKRNISHRELAGKVAEICKAELVTNPDAPVVSFPEIDTDRYDHEFKAGKSDVMQGIDDLVPKYLAYYRATDPKLRGIVEIDEARNQLTYRDEVVTTPVTFPMESAEAFEIGSKSWLRLGWDVKHVYSFTWMGRPIIQLPEDMVRIAELVYSVKPTLIIETGIAHGGSLIYYASLFEAMGQGRVIGIDIDIRAQNRRAIESHEMFHRIELVEGSSIEKSTVEAVSKLVRDDDTVMLILDANHKKDHVLAELRAYAPLVTVGSYAVAADGIMAQVAGGPRTGDDWLTSNPSEAAREFVKENSDFVISEPRPRFNEGVVRRHVTYWPDGYLKRIKA
ncbi:MAG: CmcI family methyltransferase [Nitratireductor sp.]